MYSNLPRHCRRYGTLYFLLLLCVHNGRVEDSRVTTYQLCRQGWAVISLFIKVTLLFTIFHYENF